MRLPAAMVASVLVSACCWGGAEMRSVAFVSAMRCDSPPDLDGTLDDPAWNAAHPCRLFYEYWKPAPGPGRLRTEARLLYDERGVYLGVTNFDENMAGLRAVYTTRDGDNLWQDDCNEIYFDAFGQGIGYTKFVVNSLGTMGDSRRIDAAVSLPDWNGSGWQVKTAKRGDAWTYEAFFPWQDLGRTAEPGDLWRFCLVRYAFSSGKFVGVTSSPGGNYNNPNNFGALQFASQARVEPADIARSLEALVAPPWFLPLDGGVLECTAPGASRFLAVGDVVSREGKLREEQAAEIAGIVETDGTNPELVKLAGEFQAQLQVAPSAPAAADAAVVYQVCSEQARLRTALSDLYWRIKVLELVARQEATAVSRQSRTDASELRPGSGQHAQNTGSGDSHGNGDDGDDRVRKARRLVSARPDAELSHVGVAVVPGARRRHAAGAVHRPASGGSRGCRTRGTSGD